MISSKRKKDFNDIDPRFKSVLTTFNDAVPVSMTLTVKTYIVPVTDFYDSAVEYLCKYFNRYYIHHPHFNTSTISKIELYENKMSVNKATSSTLKMSFTKKTPFIEWGDELFNKVKDLIVDIYFQFDNISNGCLVYRNTKTI